MSNFIKNVRIKNLFDEKEIDWKLNKINVLVGKNGLGKSTILKLINSAVTREYSDSLELCEEIRVEFEDGNELISRINNRINQQDIDLLLTRLSELNEISRRNESLVDVTSQYKTSFNKKIERVTSDLLKEINSRAVNRNKNIEFHDHIRVKKPKISMQNINVEFISTINMSANSVNSITTSSGDKINFLDFEIDNEVKRLNKNSKSKKNLQIKLTNALNNLFEETNKKTRFFEDKIEITLSNGKRIDYKSLSSGERQVIFIFLKIINGGVNNSLILMDEPEISLHLSWQEKLLTEITKVNSSSQIIIVTHSPAMVMDGWLDSFVDIKNITIQS